MEVEQQRIEEDLRGQLSGDVHCDDLFVQLYSSDASIYEIRPLGVVRPRTLDDVVATVRYAASSGIPLHARGSGSGLAGGALGRGLVVDFSRFLRRMVSVSEDRVRVEAGMVLDELNRQLEPRGRYFGPDPATKHVTTLGSMVALDASGSHWLAVGSTRRHLESVQMVLADGEVVELATHDPSTAVETTGLDRLITGVDEILHRHEESIRNCSPKSLVNSSGYRLDDLRTESGSSPGIQLAKLVAGSEGTLGLITAVTLRTQLIPREVGSAFLFFESVDRAAHATLDILPLMPSACDLMDRRHLSLARESDPRYEFLIPPDAEAVLLVEYQGESREEVESRLADTITLIQDRKHLATGSCVAADRIDHELLWQLARHYTPTLYRLRGLTRPLPFIEDIAVPPASLADFLPRVQQIFQQEHTTASLFGHVGHGQLHFRPFLDLANAEDIGKMDLLADQIYEEVWRVGGTISGEHGDGLSRTPFLARQFGPLASTFREVKQLFDPQSLMNPGKIVPQETVALTDNLRHVRYPLFDLPSSSETVEVTSDSVELPTIDLQLAWKPEEMASAARTCNGCAACRTNSPDSRMCPIHRYSPREEASPRAKANLARGIMSGAMPLGTVLEDACKEIADLCVHCHMCRLECPASVDIPKLMIEAKASYIATNGESLHEWLLARVDNLCHYGSKYARLTNWAVGNRIARWLMEKGIGIAQGRKLPRFRRQSFLRKAVQRRWHRSEPREVEKVLYFVDTYANYCDAELAEAFVSILEHNGISVYVPEGQRQAGMPLIARGVVREAREIAEQNVALLAEAVRQGYSIVSTEPSAVLALSHEYPQLLPDDPDAAMVAQNSFEACHYLWRLHQSGKLHLNFSELDFTLGYHTPCHTKALGIGNPAENLLQLIPGLKIVRLEKGCSGIAGLYGFQHEHYRTSLRAGLPLINAIRSGKFIAGTTECSTCKVQMEQGTTKPTIHPIKIVALAYGLSPELKQLVVGPGSDLIVT